MVFRSKMDQKELADIEDLLKSSDSETREQESDSEVEQESDSEVLHVYCYFQIFHIYCLRACVTFVSDPMLTFIYYVVIVSMIHVSQSG